MGSVIPPHRCKQEPASLRVLVVDTRLCRCLTLCSLRASGAAGFAHPPQDQRVLSAHQQRRQLNPFDGICGNAVGAQTLSAEIKRRKDRTTQQHRDVGIA